MPTSRSNPLKGLNFLKSLDKYHLVLLITLIVGYNQLFVPMRINTSDKPVASKEFKAPANSPVHGRVFYAEEREKEEDRASKKLVEQSGYLIIFNISSWEIQTNPTVVLNVGYTAFSTASAHQAFRVLRI